MEWRAHVSEDYRDLATDTRRVVLWRNIGEETEVVMSLTDGAVTVGRQPFGVASDFRGLVVPREALDALAEVIKPGPSQGETKRLEEALAVERRRVDELLKLVGERQ